MQASKRKKLYQILAKIPHNHLTTYGDLARKLGNRKLARAVGNWLNKNPYSTKKVPCFRVIESNGEIGGYAGGTRAKIRKLKKAGFEIEKGRVLDYEKFLW